MDSLQILYKNKVYVVTLPEYQSSELFKNLKEEEEDEEDIVTVQEYLEDLSINSVKKLSQFIKVDDYWGFPQVYPSINIAIKRFISRLSDVTEVLSIIKLEEGKYLQSGSYQGTIIYILKNKINDDKTFVQFYESLKNEKWSHPYLYSILISNPHLLLSDYHFDIDDMDRNIIGYLDILRGPYINYFNPSKRDILAIEISDRYSDYLNLSINEYFFEENIHDYLIEFIRRIQPVRKMKFRYRPISEYEELIEYQENGLEFNPHKNLFYNPFNRNPNNKEKIYLNGLL